jgi:hypothetical protein
VLEKKRNGVKLAFRLSDTLAVFFPPPVTTLRKCSLQQPFMSSRPLVGTDYLFLLQSRNSCAENVGAIRLTQAPFAYESNMASVSKRA